MIPDRYKTALIYNLKRLDPLQGDDADAEFDRQSTIDALVGALEQAGLQVEPLEALPNGVLLPRLLEGKFQLAFTIAEGRGAYARVPGPGHPGVFADSVCGL